jgi:hypothetical protein
MAMLRGKYVSIPPPGSWIMEGAGARVGAGKILAHWGAHSHRLTSMNLTKLPCNYMITGAVSGLSMPGGAAGVPTRIVCERWVRAVDQVVARLAVF